jgi:hypothetical protein
MAGKQTTIALLIFLIASVAPAQERVARVGGAEGWQDLLLQSGVELQRGRRDNLEVVLSGAAYRPDAETDLLLRFDETTRRDATGTYELDVAPRITSRVSRRGSAAAVFAPEDERLRLEPVTAALFSPNRVWSDFSIEFWLYPTRAAEGETILVWEGARSRGTTEVVSQEIRASIANRRLVWRFRNVFLPPDQSELEIILESRTDLVPRTWQHHLLRYDAETGLLEYLRDGRTEAVTYATSSRSERGTVYFPYIGDASKDTVEVGESLVGFLDELRVSSAFREPPDLGHYEPFGGTVVTRPLDLGSGAARVVRFDAEYAAPQTAAVHLYYRAAESRNTLRAADPDTGWTPFEPGREVQNPVQGRFIQLRAELYPGGERRSSPRLFELRVVYEPDLPPSPPTGLVAVPGDGEVTLRWNAVPEPDLTGYTVFYGTRSGRYFGTGAEIGSSPATIGERTEVTLDGLENGTLYFFAVASRDASSTAGESVLSSEVTARPSRLGR